MESPLHITPLLSWLRAPSSQHSMRGKAGHQTPSWVHRELGPWKIRLAAPSARGATTPQGSVRSAECSPDWSHAQANKNISEGVRPVSLGSEGQNWRTAPPLASGHLNERSAPGDTGSPRSIFRRGSRNPEDRMGRQRRGKDKQDTEREEKRLVKEVEAGTETAP